METLEDRTLLSGNLSFANPSTAAQLAADITQADNHPGSYSIKFGKQNTYVLNNTTGALPALKAGVTLTIDGNGDTINEFRLGDREDGSSIGVLPQ
ncbi:MAG TPA: hypothetical protein VMF69_19860 [Gemmataceae bacterium]|nr:hypothetical protein [Gemmataceae bacterium]